MNDDTTRENEPERDPVPLTGRPIRDHAEREGEQAYTGRPLATSRRDPFPYLMGAIVATTLVGVGLLVWLLVGAPGQKQVPVVATDPTRPAAGGALVPQETVPGPVASFAVPGDYPTADIALPPALPTGSPYAPDEPPRMALADFRKLYDDPATRPVILDVRSKEAYDEAHIPGAILFPLDQLATRVSELPKDKLIVAYCQ